MLHLYNTLSNSKQPFQPITSGKVRMYVCGMTVYDYCHLGHARVLVVFDLVVRYLRWLGFEVTYVRNVTDIDDKIIARAAENGETVEALTARFIEAMHEDSEALGVRAPDVEPRATGHIDLMLDMIARLIEKGMAYAADNGDVYYDVSEFKGYGKLSGKALEDLRSGARIEVNEAKNDPLDFVLWKAAKPGEPQWESPWGPGRPGWHIECSAMSTHALGDHFDIHGGGMDLQFPHHENEIAQSEGCTGQKFVNYWMHNGFVRINEEKMSKSLGNFFTVRELLKQYRPEALRYFILASHYRSPLNYADDQIDAVAGGLTRLYTALRGLPAASDVRDGEYESRFKEAMDDDFNSALAIAVLHELAGDINKNRESDPSRAAALGTTLKRLGSVLGLLEQDPDAYLKSQSADDTLSNDQIDQTIAARIQARKDKNWAEADRLRDLLKDAGIILEDKASGTIWRRER